VRPWQVGDPDDAEVAQAITRLVGSRDQAEQWVLLAAKERACGLVDLAIIARCDTDKRAQDSYGSSLEHDLLVRITKVDRARTTQIVREVDEDAARLEARKGAPQMAEEALGGVDRRYARVTQPLSLQRVS
jgi:hypothetical protein